jgi:hypothetical protein
MPSQEIVDFMLGRKSGGATSNGDPTTIQRNNGPSGVVVGSNVSPRLQSPGSAKKVQSVAFSFAKTLVNEWLETDDTLQEVVQSISGLRERLWHTSQALAAFKEREELAGWKRFGYRGGNGAETVLTRDDLQLALDYDLRQHERMMHALRRSLSTLHQAQEALGRRLDEYHRLVDFDLSNNYRFILSLEECQSLFVASASELYRKQALADEILDSVHNLLLFHDSERALMTIDAENPDPRRLARRCSERWSRHHEQSFLVEHNAILDKLRQQVVA